MEILKGYEGAGPLARLVFRREGRTKRVSSWDRTGGNRDFLTIPAGATATLADLQGAGCIRHIWITVGCRDPLYLRKVVLQMYWDGETEPSVLSPLGDFFGLGHGIARSFMSLPLATVTHTDNEGNYGGGVALNCYFPMPFSQSARLEVVNECEVDIGSFYYYIDYETYENPLPENVLRFHAQYRQEYPTRGTQGNLFEQRRNYWELLDTPNLSDEENYLILEAEGAGHYVGCVLSVDNIDPLPVIRKLGSHEQIIKEYTWWGEGDDMIFIDGEPWPPSLHGTGSEDYLSQAWGMHPRAYLYAGASIPEHDPKFPDRHQCTSYRFHIEDPILFSRSIRVSIEHGHANLQENDYSSVAYWYQTEPHKPFPPLPPVNERLPRNMRSSG
ncbi:Protein of unknown function (DUF2961) [Armatimonadetes bacterium GXS]|nr:Protein of unknown function (DUF2961) [Armatimonadetes bacterium GXS]